MDRHTPAVVLACEDGDSAQLASVGELGTLLHAANARIAALERGRIVLVAALAAFPLTLIALLVLALSHPLAPPEPSLSLVAAVIGSLLTGALVFLGAWGAAALLGRTDQVRSRGAGRLEPLAE